jgi:hypothetical protein
MDAESDILGKSGVAPLIPSRLSAVVQPQWRMTGFNSSIKGPEHRKCGRLQRRFSEATKMQVLA